MTWQPSGGEERVLTVASGDSQLRRLMLAEKIPLYSLYVSSIEKRAIGGGIGRERNCTTTNRNIDVRE